MKHRRYHVQNKLKHLRPRKKFFQRRVFWLAALVLAIAAGIFYVFFFLPVLQIINIEIAGNQTISSSEIEQIVWPHISKKILFATSRSILPINPKKVNDDILQKIPGIEGAMIKKKWPHSLDITITERKPAAFLVNSQKDTYVDQNGIAFISPAFASSEFLAIKKEFQNEPVVPGVQVVAKSIIAAAIRIKNNLRDDFNLNVKELLLSNPLIFTTQEGWQIHMDPEGDVELQIAKLTLLLKEQISEKDRKQLHYIYLQYADRAYYK